MQRGWVSRMKDNGFHGSCVWTWVDNATQVRWSSNEGSRYYGSINFYNYNKTWLLWARNYADIYAIALIPLVYFNKLKNYLFYVYECFAYMPACAPHVCLSACGGQKRKWSYRWLWTTILVLGIKSRSLARAVVLLTVEPPLWLLKMFFWGQSFTW